MGHSFENLWYRVSIDADGAFSVTSAKGDRILSNAAFRFTPLLQHMVTAFDPRRPDVIFLGESCSFQQGDVIELREDRHRQNHPVCHQATVESHAQGLVRFSPAVEQQDVLGLFGDADAALSVRRIQAAQTTTGADVSRELTQDGCVLIIQGHIEDSSIALEIRISCKSASPTISFSVSRRYGASIVVDEEAMDLRFDPPATALIAKNRIQLSPVPEGRYWLDRQGIMFGEGRASAWGYHFPGVSSLLYCTEQRVLSVNLDCAQDHRYRHHTGRALPRYQEAHATVRYAGEQASSWFSLTFGSQPSAIPRLMHAPHGFQSAYVCTEHADDTTSASQRAISYGCETITEAQEAVGGFIKHRIPMTKSVFYSNPGELSCQADSTQKQGSMRDPEFRQTIHDLHRTGLTEICPHTVRPDNATRDEVRELLGDFKEAFDSPTWIDHAPSFVRPGASADAFLPMKSAYCADLWREFGIRYVWQLASEDGLYQPDGASLDLLRYEGRSDEVTPLYWRHPNFPDVIFWASRITEGDDWYRHHTEDVISDLVSHRGVHVSHVYPARIFQNNTMLTRDETGTLRVADAFDEGLARIASWRDRGLLWIATIKDFLDHQLALEKIELTCEPDAGITVRNHNDSTFRGLTLAMAAERVETDIEYESRRDGDDLLVWFDLPAGGDVRLVPHR